MSRLSLGTMVEDLNGPMVEQSRGEHIDEVEPLVMLATERDEVGLEIALDWDESITEGALLRAAGDRVYTSNIKPASRGTRTKGRSHFKAMLWDLGDVLARLNFKAKRQLKAS